MESEKKYDSKGWLEHYRQTILGERKRELLCVCHFEQSNPLKMTTPQRIGSSTI